MKLILLFEEAKIVLVAENIYIYMDIFSISEIKMFEIEMCVIVRSFNN